jgi:thioredoxin-like negative regulator of GroEL
VRHFWHGFQKNAASVQFKKHVIVVLWSPGKEELKDDTKKISFKYPTVKIKTINVKRDPTSALKYKALDVPAVILLKDGREVDRIESLDSNPTLLENLFRRAHV